MTENEEKMLEQIYAKVCEMEKKIDKLDGRMDSLDNKLEGSFKGLQSTFTQGFADVHKGLNEIIEINKNRKAAKEIVEGIAGNGK
jgi:dsDNA-specific endonuclease/ATPase MutS2